MILMNDFTNEPKVIKDEMISAVSKVMDSGWYVLGENLKAFERNWESICKVSHAVGVGNGMDALEIALRALDIGPGDEVITTPMTAFATVLAILRTGATPVLADIEPTTALLDINSVERCFSDKTRALILVHLYGQVRGMVQWQHYCEQKNIHLIEDCAQSHMAVSQGGFAGSFGKAGAYSFYPTKNLGALGDGGALVTNDKELSDRAYKLRNYGQSVRYHHPEIGMNSRLDEMQAAILNIRLKWLEKFTRRRQQIAKAYFENIKNSMINLLADPESAEAHVYHLFVVTCPERDSLQEYLKNKKIQTLIHYPVPVHHQKSCLSIKRDPSGLSNSEQYARDCLSLPCHPQMSDQDIETVVAAVNQFQG